MDVESVAELVAVAGAAQRFAYAPYSGFSVGAALRGRSGAVYGGCNVENASYPAGLCAERAALAAAVGAGERSFSGLAVVVSSALPASPCGICRQALAEFGLDLEIVLATSGGQQRKTTLRELLPDAFGPGALGLP